MTPSPFLWQQVSDVIVPPQMAAFPPFITEDLAGLPPSSSQQSPGKGFVLHSLLAVHLDFAFKFLLTTLHSLRGQPTVCLSGLLIPSELGYVFVIFPSSSNLPY